MYILLYLEVPIFPCIPEICPVMPILEFSLMCLGKQSISRCSSCASVSTLIPEADDLVMYSRGTCEQ